MHERFAFNRDPWFLPKRNTPRPRRGRPTAGIGTRAIASSSWTARPAKAKVNGFCQADARFIREPRFRFRSARDMASIERRTECAQIDQKEISCLRIAADARM